MSNFPTLKTGAMLQYPAQRQAEYSTTILRFVDGSEQRVRNFQAPLQHWGARFTALDETEAHQFREFFLSLGGSAQNFSFTDPWTGTSYPSCSLEDCDLYEELLDSSDAATSLRVSENRE